MNFLKTFGKVYISSGALGIDGKGYWYDKILNLIPGHNFKSATFIAKTVTWDKRDGNLPLKDNLQPKDKFPKCVKFYPFEGSMMNAVGVSSPGLKNLLDRRIWSNIEDLFLISIIPVKNTPEERIEEIDFMARMISLCWSEFKNIVGIQLNISCPNTGIDIGDYIKEVQEYINILYEHAFPIDLKINMLISPEFIDRLYNYNIVTCSNTIPYRSIPEIDWDKYSGLESMGGGGLSGPILLPYVIDWIKRFREINKTIPIKACGGIFHKDDVDKVVEAGADAIEIGTVKLFRPWRIKSIIKRANKLLKDI